MAGYRVKILDKAGNFVASISTEAGSPEKAISNVRSNWARIKFKKDPIALAIHKAKAKYLFVPQEIKPEPRFEPYPEPEPVAPAKSLPREEQLELFSGWVKANCKFAQTGPEHTIEPSQGDGWIIRTPHGYVDYRHDEDQNINEIWWVESDKRGHGSELVDLMQANHPAEAIAWGVTSESGQGLMKKWHRLHPDVECYTGAHEGQFDPFGGDENDENDEIEMGSGGSNNGGSMSLKEKDQIEIGIFSKLDMCSHSKLSGWVKGNCKFAQDEPQESVVEEPPRLTLEEMRAMQDPVKGSGSDAPRIQHIDPEIDDWLAGGAEAVFEERHIRPDSSKEVSIVAVVGENDDVVGGVYSGIVNTEYGPEFSFDVAALPGYPVGMQLISAAIDEASERASEMGGGEIRLYVVNPRLIPILERRFGFDIEDEYSHGAAHMSRSAKRSWAIRNCKFASVEGLTFENTHRDYVGSAGQGEHKYWLLAKLDGKPVGGIEYAVTVPDNEATIEWIEVVEGHRRKGIGQALHAELRKALDREFPGENVKIKESMTTPEGQALRESLDEVETAGGLMVSVGPISEEIGISRLQ